jgi:FAD/FMN-containing dehydrogenase/Fe-S oxidoreductase
MAQLPVLNNTHNRGFDSPARLDTEREAIAAGLRTLLGVPDGALAGPGGEVRFDEHNRKLYSTDASLYQVEPLGVVIPASIDDAARIVRHCAVNNIALLPRGGGTSLAGQCVNRAVVMDLTPRCRTIIDVNLAARTCTVEPGIGVDELNEILARRNTGLFFAPDPATTRQAAIGGCIGNNAAGARSIRYGRTSENLERLEVCLATGERLWLGPNAGATNDTARHLAVGVIDIARRNAKHIRERFPRTIRRNAGYALDMILDQVEAGATPETLDLSKLLCGSEGTLAATLRAELTLQPAPSAKGLAIVSFATLEDAIAATQPIIAACKDHGLVAVELLDDVVLDAARGNLEYRNYVNLLPGASAERNEPKAALYVEFFGFEGAEQDIKRAFDVLTDLIRRTPGVLNNGIATYTDAPAMLKAWALRKAGEPLLHGLPGSRKPITFVEDNAVPVERLSEFVREFKKIVAKHGTRAAYWAHASVGVLHVRPMIDLHDPADRDRMRAIAVEAADLARACGGIMSGEHGDGRVRGPLIERFFGPELMAAFREVKRLFDPQGLLNPGNIVAPGPIESITDNLRVDASTNPVHSTSPERLTSPEPKLGNNPVPSSDSQIHSSSETHSPSSISTFYTYQKEQGFAHAIEQCNGAGVCRKRSGVMCPSYHGTLDERHSTRGRGNALRLAITGQFNEGSGLNTGEPNWADEGTIGTLDLCLSCKACKSECPSNVDIAKLKAEYTAQRYRQQGKVPLSAVMTGYVRVLNKVGSITPRIANTVNATAPARALIDRVMKIDRRRSLPKFSKSLYRVFKPRQMPAGTPKVILFADCFTTYNESRIGAAAGRVLESLGYQVVLSTNGAGASGCCGRSMISVGMLEQAIDTIDSTVALLSPHADDPSVKAILCIEPSCMSAITDDWQSLKCTSPKPTRERIAKKTMLVEEFADRFWDEHPARPTAPGAAQPSANASTAAQKILLHTHCHQKALYGSDTSARLLRRLVGPSNLKVLDTGCCGMAGSFGYAKNKFDLSMAIGELSLLPSVRRASTDTIICATGTSCRHQIHDGAHREALHPIEVAAMLMTAAAHTR